MAKRIILGIIVLIIVFVAYNLINQIISATKSGERLSQAADAVYQLENTNKALRNKLSQVQSPEFMESEIRNKLGLAKKGETLVVITEDKLKSVLGVSQIAQIRLPNWQGWLKVFFK